MEERKCLYCQNGRLGKLGDRTLSCHDRGDTISRHVRVRDRILAACSDANLEPVCKQKILIPDKNSRPGDIYLPSWSAGQPTALDFTITSTMQPSLISHAAGRCRFTRKKMLKKGNMNNMPKNVPNLVSSLYHLRLNLSWASQI